MAIDEGDFIWSAKLSHFYAAARDARMLQSDLAVYSVIVDKANSKTRSWGVSLAAIVADSGIPRTTAIAAVKRLELYGWTEARRAHGKKAVFTVTRPAHGTSPAHGTGRRSMVGLRRGSVHGPETVPRVEHEQVLTGTATEKSNRPARASRRPQQSFDSWRQAVTEAEDGLLLQRINAYLKQARVPPDFSVLYLEWAMAKWGGDPKPYKDWPRVILRALSEDWHHLWRFNHEGGCVLTTAGVQLERTTQSLEPAA